MPVRHITLKCLFFLWGTLDFCMFYDWNFWTDPLSITHLLPSSNMGIWFTIAVHCQHLQASFLDHPSLTCPVASGHPQTISKQKQRRVCSSQFLTLDPKSPATDEHLLTTAASIPCGAIFRRHNHPESHSALKPTSSAVPWSSLHPSHGGISSSLPYVSCPGILRAASLTLPSLWPLALY